MTALPSPRRLRHLGLLGGAALLAGCSASELAVPGNSTYSCSGLPEGVVCTSARTMHALTETRDRVHEEDLRQLAVGDAIAPEPIGDIDRIPPGGGEPVGPREGVIDGDALVRPMSYGPPPLSAEPRRAARETLRIWVAPWEDRAGNLRAPGFIYAELDARGPYSGSTTENLLQTPEMIEARAAEAAGPPVAAPGARPGPGAPQRSRPGRPGPPTVEVGL